MARLFVSFYVFIALSLVGLTAILNALMFPSESASSVAERLLLQSVKQQLVNGQELEALIADLNLELAIISQGSIDWPAELLTQLNRGQIVELHSANKTQLYQVFNSTHLIELSMNKGDPSGTRLFIYSALFFVLFGILLALWLWPLWRDLADIRKSVSGIQRDGSLPAVAVANSSVAAPIAKALNSMSEQVKNLLASQRELSGAVAHEFRTPLARLKFALAMLPEQHSGQKEIQQDIVELERLVQEMLDFTSVQAASPELSMAEIPLLSMSRALIKKLSVQQPEDLQVSVGGEECIVMADEYYLERALQNLILNAFRFAEKQVQIRVQANQSFALILVEDDGAGIPQGMLEKVFEPFFRPDKGRDRKVGGAGLGLAIVSRIAAWHNGSCTADKGSLGGAVFSLRLPKTN